MTKIDYKKELKHLYNPSAKQVSLVEAPPMRFFMIDGSGNPNDSPAYQEAIEALYALSYACKFAIKKSTGIDYGVMPLEGLWWTDDPAAFSLDDKKAWQWTAMIMQPEHVTEAEMSAALIDVKRKKGLAALDKVRFTPYQEGMAVQILYVGPYEDEAPTIARLHDFAQENGYALRGKHHEIYLSDPRRTAPERLRTVLRQPVQESDHSQN